MLLATARFVITTIQRKFLYFFVFFFPKVPRSIGTWELALMTKIYLFQNLLLSSALVRVVPPPYPIYKNVCKSFAEA